MKKIIKRVPNVSGYDMGDLNMTVKSVEDKNGRVEYVLYGVLFIKNTTGKFYDEKDVEMDVSDLSEEDREKKTFESISFQVPLINSNDGFKDMLVKLMEDALELKVNHRDKKNKK